MTEKLPSLYMKIAIAYIRTSGAINPETSIPNQIRDIKKYCEENQILLKYILVDEAESGRYTENRDQYNKLKRIVKSEHIDMVIVSFADRFARDSFEYILSIRELVKDGRQFIALYEGVVEECTSALELTMTAIKVELENEQRTKRLMDGREASVESGKFPTMPPYGYRKGKDLKLIVNYNEARVIQKLYEMYNNGDKVFRIVRELNKNPLYDGQPNMDRGKLGSYLRNKNYTGFIYSKQEVDNEDGTFHVEYIQVSKVPHEPIISEEVFNMARNKWDKNHKRITKSFYLCSSIMKCPCGKGVTGAADQNQYFTYEPQSRKEACCRFILDEVDKKLITFLTDIDKVQGTTLSDTSYENLQKQQLEIEQNLKENEHKFALGKVSKKTFLKNLEVCRSKLSELEKEKSWSSNSTAYESYFYLINKRDLKGLKRRLKKENFTFTIDQVGEINILTWKVPI